MKKLLFIAFVFFISLPSFAADQANFLVVKINNKAITYSELMDRYRFVLATSKIKVGATEDRKLLLNQVIDKMIDEELIRQEGANLKIEVNEGEVREAVEFMASQRKQNVAQYKGFFGANNLSYDNYLKQVEAEILWSHIMSEVLRSKIKVTDVEVKELFEQHKFSTNVKQFLVAEILISKSDNNAAQLAQKLTVELRGGADFKNIVRQFSSSFTSENSGEIGWVSQNDIDPKIYNAISKLGKGGYSEPVLLADGYHIFKLLDSKSENKIAERDLSAAKNAIFSRKLQSLSKGYLMDLRKKSYVEIDREKM